jgi:hypothetical protein
VPFPLSETALNVPLETPPLRENTTVCPPAVILLPAASLACSVTVIVLPETTDPLETLSELVATEIVPGFTVTVGREEVTELPSAVA